MQTTGLFSSSSPQQANVGGGSSLIGTLGAALVLVFGVVLLTGLSLDRTQTAMVRFLAEKGVALVTALESGVRSGTRSRTGIRLQYLVEELADRPDVRFIAVTMPDGTILAHSNPARVGEVLNTRGGRELGAETIAALRPSETPSWAIIDMEGSRAFVVFKTFHPKIKGEGRQDEPTVGPLPYVFLGLDLAPLEVAQAQNRERAVLLGAGVLLAGMLALLGLHAVERVRSSRRGQRVAEALAEELAVALPDGLVVFDAKGRITRMNKAALTLLGMEAPAKGKAFLERLLAMPREEMARDLYLVDTLVSTKRRSSLNNVQENFKEVYQEATEAIESENFERSTVRILYKFYEMYYYNDVQDDLNAVVAGALGKSAGKTMEEASEILYEALEKVMEDDLSADDGDFDAGELGIAGAAAAEQVQQMAAAMQGHVAQMQAAMQEALAKGDMAEYMRLAQEFQQKMMEQALGQQK